MSAKLDELRAALWATLSLPESTSGAAYSPLAKRVAAAVDAIDAGAPETASELVEALEALTREYRAHAVSIGRRKFAQSPLYPYGIVMYVDALCSNLRFRELRRGHEGPCVCALVIEHSMIEHVDSKDFEKTGENDDPYDRYVDYRCPHCGRRWRHEDRSNEQYSAWAWTPLP